MKSKICVLIVLCLGFAVGACVKVVQTHQRGVDLPDVPEATLAEAEKICRDLLAGGYRAKIQRKFPALDTEHLPGLFLTWHESNEPHRGRQVYILCGVICPASVTQADDVADHCQSVVRQAVAARFPTTGP